jgi:hypothetical protein
LRLRRHWDLLGVVLLVLAAVPAAWVFPKTLVLVPRSGYMDDDWHLDEVFKASRGIWIGRDLAFTHGPLFQWLSSVPARTMGITTGAIYATWNTVPMWCAILLVYFTLRLLMPDQSAWKRFLLLLLLCVFWSPSLRMSYACLVFAAVLRVTHAVVDLRTRPYVAGSLTALLVTIGFLLAADVGAFCIAAVVSSFAGIAFESRADRRALVRLAATVFFTVLSFVIAALAVNTFMARPFDFRFWTDSLTMIAVYRWATSFAMTPAGAIRLLAGVLCAAVIFSLGTISRVRARAAIVKRSGYVLGGTLFCLAALQSALVRSDEHHIASALSVIALLSGVILLSFDSTILSVLAAVAATVISVFCGRVHTEVTPSYTFEEVAFAPAFSRNLLSQIRKPLKECPYEFVEFDRACLPQAFAPLPQAGSSFLVEHTGARDSIAIFPYQMRYGLSSRRNAAGGLLQAYTASGPALSQIEIAGLSTAAPPAGLYFPDPEIELLGPSEYSRWIENDLTVPVDAVSNFTRTPEVWFWLQRHYRAERELGAGMIAVLRDDSRAKRIRLETRPLGMPARTYAIPTRDTILDLGVPSWSRDIDFMRLHLTVRYPFWWKLRKPERMQLQVLYADGSSSLQWFVLPPNVPTDVWFYPWKRSAVANYFDTDPARWRLGADSPVVSLRMLITPLDWVSQKPSSVTVEAADAVSLRLE